MRYIDRDGVRFDLAKSDNKPMTRQEQAGVLIFLGLSGVMAFACLGLVLAATRWLWCNCR